jgi:hypothetical protein
MATVAPNSFLSLVTLVAMATDEADNVLLRKLYRKK